MSTQQGFETTRDGLLAAADEALVEAAFRTGDFDGARRLAQRAAQYCAEHDDRGGEAAAAYISGFILHYRNIATLMRGEEADPADAAAELELFEQALGICEEIGDDPGVARASFGVGVFVQVLRDDWPAAMVHYRKAESLLPALDSAGDLYTCSEIHRHLGFYHLVADVQPAKAVEHLRTSLELRERHGEPRRIPSGLTALAWAERAAGDPRAAVELARRAVRLSHEARLAASWIAGAEQELEEAEAALAADPSDPS